RRRPSYLPGLKNSGDRVVRSSAKRNGFRVVCKRRKNPELISTLELFVSQYGEGSGVAQIIEDQRARAKTPICILIRYADFCPRSGSATDCARPRYPLPCLVRTRRIGTPLTRWRIRRYIHSENSE